MLSRTLIAALFFSAVAQGAAPVGLLSKVTGKVQIFRAGEKTPVPAMTADIISAGDRIVTGPGAQAAFLFCPELRGATLPADAEVQFDAASLKMVKGKLGDERKLPSCRVPAALALAGASQMQAGVMRLRGSDMLLIGPSRTSIATLEPRFRWTAVDGAVAYDIKLMNREERILWKESVPSPKGKGTLEALLPAQKPVLEWGQKYTWRVTARDDNDALTEAGSSFQTLPQEQSETVRSAAADLRKMIDEHPDDPGPQFLLAFLYEENGVLDQAAQVYDRLQKNSEAQAWVRTHLAELMNQLGWTKVDPE